MKHTQLKKKFDSRFPDLSNTEVWSFIEKELDKAYKKGWNKKVVAHQTNKGWCCACSADMMQVKELIESAVKDAYEKGHEDGWSDYNH